MEDTTIADRIREYVLTHGGLGGKDYKENQQAMNVDTSSDTVRGMAFGGDPLDPEKDDLVNNWLSQTMGQRPGGNPTTPPPPPPPSETSNSNDMADEKVVSSHPGTAADELDKYIQGQEEQVDKYGSPDAQKEVYDRVLQDRNSIPTNIGRSLSGIGDSIVQSVARAGNPGFAQRYEDKLNKSDEIALQQNPALQKMNLEQMQAKQGLEKVRPGSALNQAELPVLSATFKTMGIPDDQIKKFLTNPEAARKAIEVLKDVVPAKDKVKIENELKLMELRFQEQNAVANRGVAEEGRRIESSKAEQDALKELGNMAWYNRLLHPGIAGALKDKAGLEKPSNHSDFNSYVSNLPSGSTYKAPDGTTRRKK